MSMLATFCCTICSKAKNETGKGWLVGMAVKIPLFGASPIMYTVIRWEPEAAVRPQAEHLCSDKCVQAALARWLKEVRESETDEPDRLPSLAKKLEPFLN